MGPQHGKIENNTQEMYLLPLSDRLCVNILEVQQNCTVEQ